MPKRHNGNGAVGPPPPPAPDPYADRAAANAAAAVAWNEARAALLGLLPRAVRVLSSVLDDASATPACRLRAARDALTLAGLTAGGDPTGRPTTAQGVRDAAAADAALADLLRECVPGAG